MPPGYRRVLVGYLLVVGVVLASMLVSLFSVEIPEPALVPDPVDLQALPSPGMPASQPVDEERPVLLEVFPQWTLGSSPTVSVALYGRNFNDTSRVRVNLKPQERVGNRIADNLIKFDFRSEDLVGVGSVCLEVLNGDKASNAVIVPLVKPRAQLKFFGLRAGITREVQLLLLVMVAGAIGSYLHAIKSLTDYIGNRTLKSSWYWWYITRPFLGMAMATIFYAVLRGGFLAGTPADAKVVNPFGVLAIGALVGMFADQAAQKLAEIFDTLSGANDDRGGKLGEPVIDGLEPPRVPPGISPPPVLALIGERLGNVSTVRIGSEDRRPETVSDKRVTVKLRRDDVEARRDVPIYAVNRDGGSSSERLFRVVDPLEIRSAALPDATVGEDYSAKLEGWGGSSPYTWSIEKGPAWLQIDKDEGVLSGKPAAPGNERVVMKIVDASDDAASREYALDVQSVV